jgi:hypothetical protein
MEDLLSKMHRLNVHEQVYTLLHGQLHQCWPLVANDYPKPKLPSVLASMAYAYQALPPPAMPTALPQWPQMPAPTPIIIPNQQIDSPDSFF